MTARFDENPAMTFQDIKETKRYGRTDGCTHGRTHTRTDNVKTVYPPQTKFAGGIIKKIYLHLHNFNICPLNPTPEVTGVCKFKVLPCM